jgi:hypothetical protein
MFVALGNNTVVATIASIAVPRYQPPLALSVGAATYLAAITFGSGYGGLNIARGT